MSYYNGKTFVNQPWLATCLKRWFSAWLLNLLRPTDPAAWPQAAMPVVCKKASVTDVERQR